MSTPELRETWACTLRHLAAARYYLAVELPEGDPRLAAAEVEHYLHHNEFGLALESAEALGVSVSAPEQFWRELKLAAENMGLADEAARYAKLCAA